MAAKRTVEAKSKQTLLNLYTPESNLELISLRWKEGRISPPHPTSLVHQMEIPLSEVMLFSHSFLGDLQAPPIFLLPEILTSLFI